MSSSDPIADDSLYPYTPSHTLPIIFAVLVTISSIVHTYQNFTYRYWRITFFLFYANLIFSAGWLIRVFSARHPSNLGLYIAQIMLIYIAPPVYAAAEYNVLGRLMFYLPMYAPMHPKMVKYFFVYLGVVVEVLTGLGAGRIVGAAGNGNEGKRKYKSGGTLLAVSLLLQGAVEVVFLGMVALMHVRCKKEGMLTRNVRMVCVLLYGGSVLVLVRCVFRAVEAFTQYLGECGGVYCGGVVTKEWYLYAFEAAPMVLYSFWFNVLHPGRMLPNDHKRYLDVDGKTERLGPGWIDKRPLWLTLVDPFNSLKDERGGGEQTKFWLRPDQWVEFEDGSFAMGTASNVRVGKTRESGNV